jgi:tetratricopeptide (TPR) repeat protein
VDELVRRRAQGNPFFVEEIARHLHEARLLTERRGTYDLVREPSPDDVPRTIEAVIGSRLDRLSGPARQVAQVCAVLGRRFPRLLLTHFDDVRPHVDAAIGELREAHILFETVEDDEAIYVFKHALTHEVVYAGILHRRRTALHRAAAALIEGVFAAQRDRYLPLLAHHYEQAGDRGAARACYLSAAQKAAARFAFGEAERLYRGYLALVDQPTGESVSVRNFLAAEVLQPRGQLQDAAQEHDRALSEAKRIGDLVGQGTALRGLATVYWETGFMQEAEGACERALALLRRAGDRRSQGRTLMTLANIRGDQGHLEDASRLYEECLDIYREVGNDEGAALALSNLAEVTRLQGQIDRACALYEEALALAERASNRQSTGVVLSNLGVVYPELGRVDEARQVLDRALQIHQEVGALSFEAYTRCQRVRLERHLGADFDELEDAVERAMAVADKAGTIDRSLCLCERGHVALIHLEIERAYELMSQAAMLTPVSRVGAGSEFGVAITRLRRAIQAAEVAVPLFRGERVDDVPAALRSALAARGELPHTARPEPVER